MIGGRQRFSPSATARPTIANSLVDATAPASTNADVVQQQSAEH
jgi:hypothetical protein